MASESETQDSILIKKKVDGALTSESDQPHKEVAMVETVVKSKDETPGSEKVLPSASLSKDDSQEDYRSDNFQAEATTIVAMETLQTQKRFQKNEEFQTVDGIEREKTEMEKQGSSGDKKLHESLNKDDDKVDNATISNLALVQTELEGATCSKVEKSTDLVSEVTVIQSVTTSENLNNDDEIVAEATEEKNIDATPNDKILVQTDLDEVKCIEAEKTVDLVGEMKEIEKTTTSENSGIEHEIGGQSVGKVLEMIKPIISEEQEAATVIKADHEIHSKEFSEIVDKIEHKSDTDHSLLQKYEEKEYFGKQLRENLEKNETSVGKEKSRSATDNKEGEEGIQHEEHSHDACVQAKQAAATAKSSAKDILKEKIESRSGGIETGDIKEELLEEGNASSSPLESSEAEVIKHCHESEKKVEILKEDDRIRETLKKGDGNALSMESIREAVLVINSEDNYDAKNSKGEKLEVVKDYECTPKESNQEDKNLEKLDDFTLKHDVGVLQQGEIQVTNEAPTVENNFDENSLVRVIELGNDNNDAEVTEKSKKVIFEVMTHSEEIPNDESGKKPEQYLEIMTKEVELDALGEHAKETANTRETYEKVKKKEESATSVQQDNETGKEVDSEPKPEAACSNIQKENLKEENAAELYSSFTVNETGKITSEDNGEAKKLKEQFSLESKEQTEAMNFRVETEVDSSLSSSELQMDHGAITTSEASDVEIHPPQNKNLIEYPVSVPEVTNEEIKEEIQKEAEIVTSHLNSISVTKISSSVAGMSVKETEEVLEKAETITEDSNSISSLECSSMSEVSVSQKEIKQEILIKEGSTACYLSSISMTKNSSSEYVVCKKETEKILEKEEAIIKDLDSISVTEERDEMGLYDEKEEDKEHVETVNYPEEKGSSLGILDTNLTREFKSEEGKEEEVLTFANEGENITPEANEKFPTVGVENEKPVTVVEANLDPVTHENLQSSIIPSNELETKTVEASKTAGNKTALIDKITDEKADTPFTEQVTDSEIEDRSVNQEGHSEQGSLGIGKGSAGAEAQSQGNEEHYEDEPKDVIIKNKQEKNDLGHQDGGPVKETPEHEDVVQCLPSEQSTETNNFELEEIGIPKKETTDNLTDENHAYELRTSGYEITINEAPKYAKASTLPESDKDILKKEYTAKSSEEKVTDIVIEEATFTLKAGSQSQEHEETKTKYNEHLKEEASATTNVEQEARERDLKEIETEKINSSKLTEEEISKEYSKEDQGYKVSDNEDPSQCKEKQNLKDQPTVEISSLSKPGETVIDTIKEESEVKCLSTELKEPTGATDFIGEVEPKNLEGVIQSSNENVLTPKEKSDGDANTEEENRRLVASILSAVHDKEHKELSTNESNYIIVRAESEVSSKEAEQEDGEIKTIVDMEPSDIDIKHKQKSILEEENGDNIEIEADKSRKKVENEIEGKTLTTQIVNERDFATSEVLLDATVKSNIQESLKFSLEGHQFTAVEGSKTIDQTSVLGEITRRYTEVENSSTEQITGEKLVEKPKDVSILENTDLEKNTYEEVQKSGKELNMQYGKNTAEVIIIDDLNSANTGSEAQMQHDGLKNTNKDCSTEVQEENAPTILEEDQGHIQGGAILTEVHDAAKQDGSQNITQVIVEENYFNDLHVVSTKPETMPELKRLGKVAEEFLQASISNEQAESTNLEGSTTVSEITSKKSMEEEKMVDELSTRPVNFSRTDTERLEVIQEEIKEDVDISHDKVDTAMAEEMTLDSSFTKAQMDKPVKACDSCLDDASSNLASQLPQGNGKNAVKQIEIVGSDPNKVEETKSSTSLVFEFNNESLEETDVWEKVKKHEADELKEAAQVTNTSRCSGVEPMIEGEVTAKPTSPAGKSEEKLQTSSSELPSSEQKCELAIIVEMVDAKIEEVDMQVHENLDVKKEEAMELKSSEDCLSTKEEFQRDRSIEADEERTTFDGDTKSDPTKRGEMQVDHSLLESEEVTKKIIEETSKLQFETRSEEINFVSEIFECEKKGVKEENETQKSLMVENLDINEVYKTSKVASGIGLSIEFKPVIEGDISSPDTVPVGTFEGKDLILPPTFPTKDLEDGTDKKTEKIIKESQLDLHENSDMKDRKVSDFELASHSESQINSSNEVHEQGQGGMHENTNSEPSKREEIKTVESPSGIKKVIEKPNEENSVFQFETRPREIEHVSTVSKFEEEGIKEADETQQNLNVEKLDPDGTKDAGIRSTSEDTKSEPSKRQEILVADSPPESKEVSEKPIEEISNLHFKTMPRENKHVSEASDSRKAVKEVDETQKSLIVEKLDQEEVKEAGIGAVNEDLKSKPTDIQEIKVDDFPAASKEIIEMPIEETSDLQFETTRGIEHDLKVDESKKEGIQKADETQQNLNVEKLDLDIMKEAEIGSISEDTKSEPSKRQEIQVTEKTIEETLDLQIKTRHGEIEHVFEVFESEKEGIKEADEVQQNLIEEKLDLEEVKESGIVAISEDPKSEPSKRQEIKVADSPSGSKRVTEKPIEETSDLQFGTRSGGIEHVLEVYESDIEGIKEVDETQQNQDMEKLDLDGMTEAGFGSISKDTKSETSQRQGIQVADSASESKEVAAKPIGETSDFQFKTRPGEIEHGFEESESEKAGVKKANEAQQSLIMEKLDRDEVKEAGIGVVSVDTKSDPNMRQETQTDGAPSGCKKVTEKPIEETSNLQFETRPNEIEHDSKVLKFEKEGIKEVDESQKNQNVEKIDLNEAKDSSQIPKSLSLGVELEGEISAPEAFPTRNLDEKVQILSSTLPHEDGINENTEEIKKEVKMQGDGNLGLQKNEATKFKILDFGCVPNKESQICSSNTRSGEGSRAEGGHTTFELCKTQDTHIADTTLLSENVIEKPIEETSNLWLDKSTTSIEHVAEAFESKHQDVQKEDETQKSITLEKVEPDEIIQASQGTSKSTCLGDDLDIKDNILARTSLEGKLEEQLQAPSSALTFIELENEIMLTVNEKEQNKEQVEMQPHEDLEMQKDVAAELKVWDFGHVINKESLIASLNEVHQEEGGTLDRGTTLECHKILETHATDPFSGSSEMEEKTIEEKSNMQFERSAETTEHASEASESKNQLVKKSGASQQSLAVEKLKQHEINKASQVISKGSSIIEPEAGIITYETIPKEKLNERQQVASSALLPNEQEHGIGITIQKIDDNTEEVDLKVVDSLSVENEDATELKVAEVELIETEESQMDTLTETPINTSNQQFETSLKPIEHVVESYNTKNKAVEEADESQQSLTEEKPDQDEVNKTSQIASKPKCLYLEPIIEDETTAHQILHVEKSKEQLQEDGTEIKVKKTEAKKEVEIHIHKNAADLMDASTRIEESEVEVELSRETQLDSLTGVCDDQGRNLDGDTKSEKRQESDIVNSLADKEKLTEKIIEKPLGLLLEKSLKAKNYIPEVPIQEEISNFDNEIKEKHLETDVTYLRVEEDQLDGKIEPNIATEYMFSKEEVSQQQKEVSNDSPSSPFGKEATRMSTIVNEKTSKVLEKAETSERKEHCIDGNGTVKDGRKSYPDEIERKDVEEGKSPIDLEDQGVTTNSEIKTKQVITQPEKKEKPERGIETLHMEGCTESTEIQKSRDIQQVGETAREISEKKPTQTEVSIGKTKTTISTGNADVLIGTSVETPLTIEGQETQPEKTKEVVKAVEYGEEKDAESPGEKTREQSITADWDKVSLADLINRSSNETFPAGKAIVEESEQTAGKEEHAEGETQDAHDGHARPYKQKEEDKENEHDDRDSGSDAPVVVEASKDIDVKATHKKSHGILSGVGSKVKHSISKVKKAITGKSSHQKAHSPK